MRLAIVRHGKAVQRSDFGSDRSRRLRPRGEAQARWLAERFAATDWKPAAILSSPYERAIATARLIQSQTQSPLEVAAELECDEPISRIFQLLERQNGRTPLMLVGHNPQLSQLVAALIGGPTARALELRTGEAALLQFAEHTGLGSAALIDTWRLEEDPD